MRTLTAVEVEGVSGGDGGILETIGPDGTAESLDKLLARFFQVDSGGVVLNVPKVSPETIGCAAGAALAVETGIGPLGGAQIGAYVGGLIGVPFGPIGVAVGFIAGRSRGGFAGAVAAPIAGCIVGGAIANGATAPNGP